MLGQVQFLPSARFVDSGSLLDKIILISALRLKTRHVSISEQKANYLYSGL